MKRTFICLLLLISLAYIPEGYKLLTTPTTVQTSTHGTLSDIAQEVIAIPLETNNRCLLSQAKQIRRDGNDLFLLNKQQLYHFTCSGQFVNQITFRHSPTQKNITVTDYVVDPIQKHLIVLDDCQHVYYYDYNGKLITQINLPDHQPWNKILKLAYYDRHIWATTNQITTDKSLSTSCLEQWLYKFDLAFNPVEAYKLTSADLGRPQINYAFTPEMAVTDQQVYVHSPSLQPNEILKDTLYLISRNALDIENDKKTILPLRISSRFLISNYYNACALQKSYTFCFDKEENKSFTVKEGFEDNFYHTGRISELQAMDVYNTSYCYYKMGNEVKKAFPDRKEGDNPVLFIVKLKA